MNTSKFEWIEALLTIASLLRAKTLAILSFARNTEKPLMVAGSERIVKYLKRPNNLLQIQVSTELRMNMYLSCINHLLKCTN